MDQREQALLEQRTRNITHSKSYAGVIVDFEPIEVHVLVENKTSTAPVHLPTISKFVTDELTSGLKEGKVFDIVLNDIYNDIAQNYPERDVEIKIFDPETKFTVMKIYNHQP